MPSYGTRAALNVEEQRGSRRPVVWLEGESDERIWSAHSGKKLDWKFRIPTNADSNRNWVRGHLLRRDRSSNEAGVVDADTCGYLPEVPRTWVPLLKEIGRCGRHPFLGVTDRRDLETTLIGLAGEAKLAELLTQTFKVPCTTVVTVSREVSLALAQAQLIRVAATNRIGVRKDEELALIQGLPFAALLTTPGKARSLVLGLLKAHPKLGWAELEPGLFDSQWEVDSFRPKDPWNVIRGHTFTKVTAHCLASLLGNRPGPLEGKVGQAVEQLAHREMLETSTMFRQLQEYFQGLVRKANPEGVGASNASV